MIFSEAASRCRPCGAPRADGESKCAYCQSSYPGAILGTDLINRLSRFFDAQDEDKRRVDRTGRESWGVSSWNCSAVAYSSRRGYHR